MGKRKLGGSLGQELERRIRSGECVYCRVPATPEEPLTREHVIPRARGGGRHDARIIVPACAKCNHHRGCEELVPFLMARPYRIRSFLEYLSSLPWNCLEEVDLRVFAELYTAVWLLSEGVARGHGPRKTVRTLCGARRLHRRRHAARRILGCVAQRLERSRSREWREGPSCLLAAAAPAEHSSTSASLLDDLRTEMITILALTWQVPAERVLGEVAEELEKTTTAGRDKAVPAANCESGRAEAAFATAQPHTAGDVVALDGRRPAGRARKRMRRDQRGGRGVRARAA